MTLEQQRIDATSMVAKELREREEKQRQEEEQRKVEQAQFCLLYTSPSPRD